MTENTTRYYSAETRTRSPQAIREFAKGREWRRQRKAIETHSLCRPQVGRERLRYAAKDPLRRTIRERGFERSRDQFWAAKWYDPTRY